MNDLSVYGRLASDVTLREANGKEVAGFRLACPTGQKLPNSNDYITNFYNVSAWGNNCETAKRFLQKGHRCAISGELVIRPYVGTDGTNHLSIDLKANNITLVETKAEVDAKSGVSSAAPESAPATSSSYSQPEDVDTDELPF